MALAVEIATEGVLVPSPSGFLTLVTRIHARRKINNDFVIQVSRETEDLISSNYKTRACWAVLQGHKLHKLWSCSTIDGHKDVT